MGTILAFSGKLGSGKDYCAMKKVEELNNNGYVLYLISFADPIKQILRDAFGFEKGGKIDDIYPPLTKEYIKQQVCQRLASVLVYSYGDETYKTIPQYVSYQGWIKLVTENYDKFEEEFVTNVLGAKTGEIEYHIAFRKLGQLLGTELGRYVKDSIWIDYALAKINYVFDNELADYAVITDCRFVNEYNALIDYGMDNAIPVEIYGIVASDETRAKRRKLSIKELVEQDQHGSEREIDLINQKLDARFVINNEG